MVISWFPLNFMMLNFLTNIFKKQLVEFSLEKKSSRISQLFWPKRKNTTMVYRFAPNMNTCINFGKRMGYLTYMI